MIYDTIIIGAGQAGLATGYYLQQQGLRFLILERAAKPGNSWLSRYESLRLFTPSQYSSLPGLPFPLPGDICPTKNQVAGYFAQYIAFHQLPVQFDQQVTELTRLDDRFELRVTGVAGSTAHYRARQVVVATGSFQHPYIPSFGTRPAPSVFQVHSSQYTHPTMIPEGNVLVVGAGNSGALLSVELANTPTASQRKIYLSTKKPLEFKPLRWLGKSIFWWGNLTGFFNLPVDSWLGRRLKNQPEGIYSDDLKQLIREGRIFTVPEITSFSGNNAYFKNGLAEVFGAILWATGYRSDYRWIAIPGALDQQGNPVHRQGVSPVKGLYFMGLPWQRTATSMLILGAVKDARFIAGEITKTQKNTPALGRAG